MIKKLLNLIFVRKQSIDAIVAPMERILNELRAYNEAREKEIGDMSDRLIIARSEAKRSSDLIQRYRELSS